MDKELFRIVVGAVIVNEEGKFLLGKRHSKDDNLPDFWSIPAGHIEVTSTDINTLENNLIREIKEEIGVKIKIINYLDSHSWVDPEYKKIIIIFLCQIKSGEPKPQDETSQVNWFDISEVSLMNLPPNVYRVIEKAKKTIERIKKV